MADADAQPIIASFRALTSTHARQAAFRGILDQLRPHEWRDVKDRYGPKTFQCDLIANLSLEIVALIAKYLSLADLLLLQRVSRRWRQLLASPAVCHAALRVAVSPHVLTVDSPDDLPKLLKKTLRMERCVPAVTATFLSPFPHDYLNTLQIEYITYADGLFAWVDDDTSRRSITVIHLWTGQKESLSTENRERLVRLCISKPFIAAISTQGFCHVWNLDTHTQKSFRLPSSAPSKHFIICGTKVALTLSAHCVVYFCFDSGLTRIIPVEGEGIELLQLDPAEDEFTVVLLCKKNGKVASGSRALVADARLYIKRYALDPSDHDFYCVRSHCQDLPVETPGDTIISHSGEQEVVRGQSSCAMWLMKHSCGTCHSVYLSLEPGTDNVEAHSLSLDMRDPYLFWAGQGVVHTIKSPDDVVLTFSLLHTRFSPSSSEAALYQYSAAKTMNAPGPCSWMLGDAQFVVIPSIDKITVWSWDETWQPPDIPELKALETS